MTPVWYCPICQAEGSDPRVEYCPEDGALVQATADRGAEWIGRTLEGKYKVLRFLGAGGMAEVFEVEKLPTGKRVALKLLRSVLADDQQVAERFRQEAMLISLIAHPNVVALQDFGTLEDGTNYMAMELLSGVTLAQALESEGPSGSLRAPAVLHVTDALVDRLLGAPPPKAAAPSKPGAGRRIEVQVPSGSGFARISADVERQYLRAIFDAVDGDLDRMATELLGPGASGRRVHLRLNQLGLRMRELRGSRA